MSFRYITICDQCLTEVPDWENTQPDGWVSISATATERTYNLCNKCWEVATNELSLSRNFGPRSLFTRPKVGS